MKPRNKEICFWTVSVRRFVMIAEMNKKIISISSKRQLTIPGAFFAKLGFEDKAECIIRDNELVIRPARIDSNGEFAEEILSDLIKEGYSGQALLKEFKNRQAKVRPAVKKMLDDGFDWAVYSDDVIHPNTWGHRFIADCVINALKEARNRKKEETLRIAYQLMDKLASTFNCPSNWQDIGENMADSFSGVDWIEENCKLYDFR